LPIENLVPQKRVWFKIGERYFDQSKTNVAGPDPRNFSLRPSPKTPLKIPISELKLGKTWRGKTGN
jgi:hypothetical protein